MMKVTGKSSRHTETGSTNTKRKENTAEKQPNTPQKAKKYKLMDSDEDDAKPQNEPGTSSDSETTVYYFFNKDEQQIRKDQLQVLILVMKTVSTAMRTVHRVMTPEERYPSHFSRF